MRIEANNSIQFNSISAEGVASSLPLVAVAVVVVVVAGVEENPERSRGSLMFRRNKTNTKTIRSLACDLKTSH